MKLSMDLVTPSSPEWLEMVLTHFDLFLQDHANCERKASSMVMSFVAKYPDRVEIIPTLIELGVEELTHFQEVYALMERRGVRLPDRMMKDEYATKLMKLCRTGRDEHFLDRLLVASVIETRGAERFRMIADGLEDRELGAFYKHFWISEAKHGHLFVKMAQNYFSSQQIEERLSYFIERESEVIQSLPLRAALH